MTTREDERAGRGEGLSRRSLLRRAARSGGGALAFAAFAGTARAQAKQAKEAVNYQDSPQGDQRCGNCVHFVEPNACRLVEGEISPNGWCQLWTARS